ncbi:bacteriophage DNA circulation protein [Gluconobacter frateurii M-2]|nr:bacteriophage DNA circulation protein [Gluconobacter frateurii M-2]
MSGTLARTASEYLQCSFRGVPFAVVASGGSNGRKQAEHDYPGKYGVWVEDLGKRARRYRILGMLVGALCYTQRDLLSSAAEQAGPGLLMHPSIGLIKAAVTRFEWQERAGYRNVIDLEFEFVEQKDLLSTLIVTALHASVAVASLALGAACRSSYVSRTSSAWAVGSTVGAAARQTVSDWAAGVVSAVSSPQAQAASVTILPGNNGRYSTGSGAVTNSSATEASALSNLTTSRAEISVLAASALEADSASDLADIVSSLASQLRAAVSDPSVQIFLLWSLAIFSQDIAATTAPIGAAISTAQAETSAYCRRCALAAIGDACSDWQPASSDDAQTMIGRVVTLFEAEEIIAGDAQDDASWQAIRDLRVQVTDDLLNRAANLPDIITVQRNAPLPALVLGQQLYADATRADDLIRRANPVHPAFMPLQFEALSS